MENFMKGLLKLLKISALSLAIIIGLIILIVGALVGMMLV